MIRIKVITNPDSEILKEITQDSPVKWGDSENFLSKLTPHVELMAEARDESGKLVGFSVAKRIINKNAIGIAFLATRVKEEFRNQGIAKKLIRKIAKKVIIENKFLSFWNLLKPAYFISATANPMVFESLRKTLNLIPSFSSRKPDKCELELAQIFADILSPKGKFDAENFVLEGAFVGSAEHYMKENEIPWSNNEETNKFLDSRIKLKEKTGDGIVMIGKI